jgi:hypothetical protein
VLSAISSPRGKHLEKFPLVYRRHLTSMKIGAILHLLLKSEREILPNFRCKIFPTICKGALPKNGRPWHFSKVKFCFKMCHPNTLVKVLSPKWKKVHMWRVEGLFDGWIHPKTRWVKFPSEVLSHEYENELR